MEGRTPNGEGKEKRGGSAAGFRDRLRSTGSRARELPRRLSPNSRRALVVAAAVTVMFAAYSILTAGPTWWNPGAVQPARPVPETEERDLSGSDPEADRARIVVHPDTEVPAGAEEGSGEVVAEEAEGADERSSDLSADPTQGMEAVIPQPETFVWPVEGTVHTRFGWQFDEQMGDWRYLEGIRLLPDAEGAAVLAAAGGVVKEVSLDPQKGWRVEIEHAPGYRTRYANLSRAYVQPGDTVARGDSIGEAGEAAAGFPEEEEGSERADARKPMDFVVIWNEEPVDPLAVLPSKR